MKPHYSFSTWEKFNSRGVFRPKIFIIDQRAKVEEQITELQDALDVLKYKTWLYEVALEAGTTAVHDNMPLEDMPQNIQKIKERIRRLTDDMEQQYIRASQNEEKN